MNCSLHHISNASFIDRNEALVVHEGKETHNELAVHTIGNTAVARNGLAEVFDLKGTFEAGGEETAEGRNEGGECCENEDVELHWGDVNGTGDLEEGLKRKVGKERRDAVGMMYEYRVWGAGEAGEYVRAKVLASVSLRIYGNWAN